MFNENFERLASCDKNQPAVTPSWFETPPIYPCFDTINPVFETMPPCFETMPQITPWLETMPQIHPKSQQAPLIRGLVESSIVALNVSSRLDQQKSTTLEPSKNVGEAMSDVTKQNFIGDLIQQFGSSPLLNLSKTNNGTICIKGIFNKSFVVTAQIKRRVKTKRCKK